MDGTDVHRDERVRFLSRIIPEVDSVQHISAMEAGALLAAEFAEERAVLVAEAAVELASALRGLELAKSWLEKAEGLKPRPPELPDTGRDWRRELSPAARLLLGIEV